jgi:hypothetical protein
MFIDKTTSQKKKAPEERNGKKNSPETAPLEGEHFTIPCL